MSWPFYIGLVVAISLQLLAMFGPLGTLLHVVPVAMNDLIITSVGSFIALIAVAETHKFVGRYFFQKGEHRLVANTQPDMVQ